MVLYIWTKAGKKIGKQAGAGWVASALLPWKIWTAELKEPLGFLLKCQTGPEASVERNKAPNGKHRFLPVPSSEAKHLLLVLLETQHSSSFKGLWAIHPQSAIMESILFPSLHTHTHTCTPLTSLAYSRVSVLCGAQDPSIRGGFSEDYRGPSSSDCSWGQAKDRDWGPKAGGRQGGGGGLLRSWWKSQVKPDHRAQNEAVTAT